MTRSAQLTIRINDDERSMLRMLASDDDRSSSDYLRLLIKREFAVRFPELAAARKAMRRGARQIGRRIAGGTTLPSPKTKRPAKKAAKK